MRLKQYILALLVLTSVILQAQVDYKKFVIKSRHELAEGRFTEAMALLNRAIENQPNNFEAYFLRGIAKFNLDDINGATIDFDKTLELHPLYINALQYRGMCHQRLNRHREALTDFAQVIELNPYNADIYFTRAITYLQLSRYEDAISDNDMALSIKPNMVMAYVNRGIAKSNLNKHDEALDDLNKASQLDVFNPDVYFKRAMVNARAERHNDALNDLNEAMSLEKDNPLFYFNRAVTYLHLGDTTAAMNDYETVNKLDKRNALTYFNRGILYATIKDYDNALLMFDLVTSINPNNIYGYFNRSMLFCELKQWNNAEADLDKVIQLKPDFIGAWINRAAVRNAKGNTKGALADKQHAMRLMDISERRDADIRYRQYADSAYIAKIIHFESDFVNSKNLLNLPQYVNAEIKPFADMLLTVLPSEEYNFSDVNKHFYIDTDLVGVNENLRYKLAVQTCNNAIVPDTFCHDDAAKTSADTERLLKAMLYHHDMIYDKAIDLYSAIVTEPLHSYAQLNLAVLRREEMSVATTPTIGEVPPNHVADSSIIDALETIIAENNKNPYLWYNLGNAHLRNKDYNKAIDDFSNAISLQPEFAEAYYNRALTLVFIGEINLAASDLSRAGELGVNEAYLVMKRYAGR